MISAILGVTGRMVQRDGVSSDPTFGGANLYQMLTVFIRHHLTRVSVDVPTESPVGEKRSSAVMYVSKLFCSPKEMLMVN